MQKRGVEMVRRISRSVCAVVAALAVVVVVVFLESEPVAGQGFWPKDTPILPMYKQWAAIKAKLPPYTPPRTPDGVPDFQGRWGGAGGDEQLNVEGHEVIWTSRHRPRKASYLGSTESESTLPPVGAGEVPGDT